VIKAVGRMYIIREMT